MLDITTNVSPNSPLIQWAKSQDNKHIAMGHIGTHIDVYEKTNIPLDYFKCNGILFNVENKSEVCINDINLSLIKENDFVIFKTGQIEKYNYGDKQYFDNHPQLSNKLINALIDKKIRFIGIDCAGIRNHKEHEEADRKCEKNNIYVIENLSNLSSIKNLPFNVYTMWLNDEEMTGLRCRVLIEQ